MLLSTFVADISVIKSLAFVMMGVAVICLAGLIFLIMLHVRSQVQLDTAHKTVGKMFKTQARLTISLKHAIEGQKRTHALLDAIMSNTMDLTSSARFMEREVNSRSKSNANNSVVVNAPAKYEDVLFKKLGEERKKLKEQLKATLLELESANLINQELANRNKPARPKS